MQVFRKAGNFQLAKDLRILRIIKLKDLSGAEKQAAILGADLLSFERIDDFLFYLVKTYAVS